MTAISKLSWPLLSRWRVGCLFAFLLTLPSVAQSATPEVAATWTGGIHLLPATVTVSGETERAHIANSKVKRWDGKSRGELLKPGAKVPAVVFLHGCRGPLSVADWGPYFTDLGFAFFAPDSFQRPGREPWCYGSGHYAAKAEIRHEELSYALDQVRKLSWVDQQRLILVGKSEGGMAVSQYAGDGFIAHIILAFDCKYGMRARDGVAVLNLVGAEDPREELCWFWRSIGGSASIALEGLGHNFEGILAAEAAVTRFLEACCGYVPEQVATADATTEARALVAEYGPSASIMALTKAEDAEQLGDMTAYEFWLKVHHLTEQPGFR